MAEQSPLEQLRAQREAAAQAAAAQAAAMRDQVRQQQQQMGAAPAPAAAPAVDKPRGGKSRPATKATGGFGDWHIPRAWLDTFAPVSRIGGGGLFVVYSSLSTIILMAGDLEGLLGDSGTLIPYRYWASLTVALVLFIGEVITSERWPQIYWGLLVPDIIYTARSMALWMPKLVETAPFLAYLLLLWGFWWLGLVHGWPRIIQYLVVVLVGLVAYAMMWGTTQEGASAELRGIAVLVFAWTASIVNGYLVARFGELLLLGRRRALT